MKLINECFVLESGGPRYSIFQCGNKLFCNNYRPVSTMSHITQVFDRLVNVGLSYFAEKYIPSNFQLGFRPAYSPLSMQYIIYMKNVFRH